MARTETSPTGDPAPARRGRLARLLLAAAALLAAAGVWLAAKAPAGERAAPRPRPAARSGPPATGAPAPESRLGVERRKLEIRLAALEDALRPFPTEVPLRTLFRGAEIELRLAAEAERRGERRAAALALSRAAADIAAAEERLAARTTRQRDPAVRRRWQEWADAAVARSRAAGAAAVVDKLGRRVVLYERGRAAAAFAADLGSNPLDDKLYAGDAATPEGVYRVIEKKEGGATRFHRALLLDYPTAQDRREYEAARRAGLVPKGHGIGGLIEIHGHGGRGSDWTNGCVALRDADMDRLYARLPLGAPVAIVGTAELPGVGAAAGGDER